MIKKILTAGAVLGFVTCGAAEAADVEDLPVFDWSGPYVGLNAGWSFSDTDASVEVPDDSEISGSATTLAEGVLDGTLHGDGFTGGLTLGFNHQFDNLMLGIEGDANFLDHDGTRDKDLSIDEGEDNARGRDKINGDFVATLRLRLGLAMDQTLFYVTGGGAYTDLEVKRTFDWDFDDGCPEVGGGLQRCHAGDAQFDLGWVVGAGVEHAFDENWTFKVEYLFADFGKEDFTTVNSELSDQDLDHSFDLEMHIVRAGLNWRFGP